MVHSSFIDTNRFKNSLYILCNYRVLKNIKYILITDCLSFYVVSECRLHARCIKLKHFNDFLYRKTFILRLPKWSNLIILRRHVLSYIVLKNVAWWPANFAKAVRGFTYCITFVHNLMSDLSDRNAIACHASLCSS